MDRMREQSGWKNPGGLGVKKVEATNSVTHSWALLLHSSSPQHTLFWVARALLYSWQMSLQLASSLQYKW